MSEEENVLIVQSEEFINGIGDESPETVKPFKLKRMSSICRVKSLISSLKSLIFTIEISTIFQSKKPNFYG